MAQRSPLLLAVLVLLCFAGLRFTYIDRLPVHNDERHFALDGMWVHARLPVGAVLRILLYDHVHPHPFYNPRTHELGYHGELESGYRSVTDDLGPYPRVGHPCLYMLVLGGLFALGSEDWLLAKDHVVCVARGLNTVLDVMTLALLFDLLRRRFHRSVAFAIVIPLAAWPYTFVLGSLAYLDSPGCCLVMTAVWYYVVRVRDRQSSRLAWAWLGMIAAASVLVKQTNLVVFPILVSLVVLWPPALSWRRLCARAAVSLAAGAVSFVLICNPVAFYEEARHPADPVVASRQLTVGWAIRQLSFPFQSSQHYGFRTSAAAPSIFDPVVVTLYRWCTPTFFGAFAGAIVVLMLARRWRFFLLIITVIAFVILVPYGTILRRLVTIVPCASIVIAAALTETGHWLSLLTGRVCRQHVTPRT